MFIFVNITFILMFLNSILLLNIYFFENIIFFYDNFVLFSEINDVLFIFFLAFAFTKKIISSKSQLFFLSSKTSANLKISKYLNMRSILNLFKKAHIKLNGFKP